MSDEGFTHLDSEGRARMVDVGGKEVTQRRAVARARVTMQEETAQALADGTVAKGDVLAVARVAGIQAAKRTSELIPLCQLIQDRSDLLSAFVLTPYRFMQADTSGSSPVEADVIALLLIGGWKVAHCGNNSPSKTSGKGLPLARPVPSRASRSN